MKREIKIFKSFEEQADYHLEIMAHTTPMQRLQSLYSLQQFTRQITTSYFTRLKKTNYSTFLNMALFVFVITMKWRQQLLSK